MKKIVCLVAMIVFAFPAIAAAPAPANPDQPVPGIGKGCTLPPPIPGKALGCMVQESTGRAACVFDVGRIEDGLGLRWQLFLTIGRPTCDSRWVPVELKGVPHNDQVVPDTSREL